MASSISSGLGEFRMGNALGISGSLSKWLSSQWEALHGAPIVWIKAYQPSHRSRNRLSRYVISQYVQDQCGYVNMCWSWKRSLGFPIGKMWEEMRNQWQTQNIYLRIRKQIEVPDRLLKNLGRSPVRPSDLVQ
ncbi:MAG: hypothetical protein IPL14_16655 [Nitrospira sp.]|nr:hypothetical protein [Nitrospira sp.]